ncbi:MAG: hypothetical protein COA97_11415 [Flavobacteriales bacterium]|nr:MAG: hypothetical protein COA97_11415 [Flavobacteriales bacterium]
MKKNALFLLSLFISLSLFSQIDKSEKIKYRKLPYADFKKLSVNDTSSAVIDLFFDKKDNAIYNQMSLLPLTIILLAIPPAHFVGVGSAAISVPLFINGSYTLVKYRKKKLYMVLTEYKQTQNLPIWVRKKVNRRLKNYELLPINY